MPCDSLLQAIGNSGHRHDGNVWANLVSSDYLGDDHAMQRWWAGSSAARRGGARIGRVGCYAYGGSLGVDRSGAFVDRVDRLVSCLSSAGIQDLLHA